RDFSQRPDSVSDMALRRFRGIAIRRSARAVCRAQISHSFSMACASPAAAGPGIAKADAEAHKQKIANSFFTALSPNATPVD
ncbi:MAG: hypothetical protein JKY68_02605, partial [Rhodospirillales bacterium]|nr:hypothetical protein [Rhodospirillales bacterium]